MRRLTPLVPQQQLRTLSLGPSWLIRAAHTRALVVILLAFIGAVDPVPLRAGALNIVSVAAPDIICLFSPDCTITSEEERAEIFHWFYNTGDALLHSQVWKGRPGSPAAGLYAYIYRIDLTSMVSQGGPSCAARFSVPAPGGAIAMDLNGDGQATDHVFVITQGGLGILGPEIAYASLGKIWFDFGDVYTSTGICPGDGSFFFGFVSATPAASSQANVEFIWVDSTVTVPTYAPGVVSFGFPTQPIAGVNMALASNILQLLSIPAQGGGFEVQLGESHGWQNAFSEMRVGRSGEYAITAIGRGTIGSREQPFSGIARLWVTNGLLFTSADFSAAGVSNLVLEYRDATGGLVGQTLIPNGGTSCGLPLCTNEGPLDVIPVVCSNAFVSLNGEPAACWSFCHDVCAIDVNCSLVALHAPIRTICVLGKNPSVGPVQAITNIQVLLAGVDSVNSTAQSLNWSNTWHQAEGDVILTAMRQGVQVAKASLADQGGINIGNYAAHIAELNLQLQMHWWSNFVTLPRIDLSALGATSGGQQQLASVSLVGVRAGLQITADFSPLGSSAYDAFIFLGSSEVGTYSQPRSIIAPESPPRVSFVGPGFTVFHPPNGGFILSWATPVTVHSEGQPDLTGDTLLLLPLRPTGQVLQADSLSFFMHGLSDVTLGRYHALPAVQNRLENVQLLGDGSVRFRSDTLPGATYSLELIQDLGVLGPWQTLESFPGNGFSRFFSVPAARGQGYMRLRVE